VGERPRCSRSSFTEHSCAGPDDRLIEQIRPKAGKSRSALIALQTGARSSNHAQETTAVPCRRRRSRCHGGRNGTSRARLERWGCFAQLRPRPERRPRRALAPPLLQPLLAAPRSSALPPGLQSSLVVGGTRSTTGRRAPRGAHRPVALKGAFAARLDGRRAFEDDPTAPALLGQE
jgi:hypothetical protein